MKHYYRWLCMGALAGAALVTGLNTRAQMWLGQRGQPVPPEVEQMYLKGLRFLVKEQAPDGGWSRQNSMESGPGITGLALLAILAHGDDPNVGPYAETVHKAVKNIISKQNPTTGYIGNTMYHHGFATLALAEAYGVVMEPGIGPALQKAVDLIIVSQKTNPKGAWRYSPDAKDADTTVAGAQMVALAAARNAGIGVPEDVLLKGVAFYRSCQCPDGGIGYTENDSGNAIRTSISALVMTLNDQRETDTYKAASAYLKRNRWRDGEGGYGYQYYAEYYMAQAAFHMDEQTWMTWNSENLKNMLATQQKEGNWSGNMGPHFSTSAALLSLALNYRFLPIYER